MARKKIYRQAKEYQIKDSLIGLELKALSVVLDRETLPRLKTKARLQAFRDAMMVSLKRGKKEAVPHEIVEDEYLIMLEALKNLRTTGLGEIKEVEHEVKPKGSRAIRFLRPFPCSEDDLSSFEIQLLNRRKVGVIARKLVVNRLAVSETTVKNAIRHKKRRRFESTPEQRLLVSLFLDVTASSEGKKPSVLQTMILDTLLAIGYSPIAIYYVIQVCHDLSRPVSLVVNTSEIERLCGALLQKSGCSKGQFKQWLIHTEGVE